MAKMAVEVEQVEQVEHGKVNVEFVPSRLTDNYVVVEQVGEGFNKVYIPRETFDSMGIVLPKSNGKVKRSKIKIIATLQIVSG